MTKEKHHPLSPSSLNRWRFDHCPGSARLIYDLPDEPKSQLEAARGTVAHTIAAEYFLLNNPVSHLKGRTVTQEGHEILVDQKMIDGVQMHVSFIESLAQEYKLPLKAPYFGVEEQVKVPGETSWGPVFGTTDNKVWVPYGPLHIIDYKNGFQSVKVKDNDQLNTYALGSFLALSEDDQNEVTEIIRTIVQPNSLGGGIFSDTITVDDLLAWNTAILQPSIEAASAPTPTLRAGTWCDDSFCPIRLQCPVWRKERQDSAGAKFMEKQLPVVSENDAKAALVEMTPVMWAALLENIPKMKSAIKLAEDTALELFITGQLTSKELPDWKLVQGEGNRQWGPDAEKGIEQALLAFDGAVEDDLMYTEPELKSVAQMEKALKAAKIKLDINQFTVRPLGARKLVPASDSKPDKSAINVFAGVSETTNGHEVIDV